jgi:hypothetical protein
VEWIDIFDFGAFFYLEVRIRVLHFLIANKINFGTGFLICQEKDFCTSNKMMAFIKKLLSLANKAGRFFRRILENDAKI